MRYFVDGQGRSFAEAEQQLRDRYGRSADFPKAKTIRDKATLEQIGLDFPQCQACGGDGGVLGLHRHHIICGVGRSDERTSLIMLCSDGGLGCHTEAHGGRLSLANVLWLKWRDDSKNLDWMRLAILARRFLPRPEPPT